MGYLEEEEAPKDKAAYQQNPMTHYQFAAKKYSDILIWGKYREMNCLQSTADSRNRKSTVLQQGTHAAYNS